MIGSPFVSDFTGSQGVPCARLYDLLTRRYGVLTVALESVSYDARVRIKWDHMGVHPAPEGHELLALAVASTISHDLASRSHDLASRSHEASSIQLPPRASLSESPPILLSSAWEDIDRAWTCQVCLWDGSLAPIRIPPIPSRIPPHRIAIWVGSLSLSLRSWIPLVSGSHLGQDPTWVRTPLRPPLGSRFGQAALGCPPMNPMASIFILCAKSHTTAGAPPMLACRIGLARRSVRCW